MSELINNQRYRIDELKKLLRQMHNSGDIAAVKEEIELILKTVPHEDIIAAEQELIAEGIPLEKMLELCDLHSKALSGLVSPSKRILPAAHPVTLLQKENLALKREMELLKMIFNQVNSLDDNAGAGELFIRIHSHFNNLMDVEKHYSKKENLIFPFLEKYNITGPSTVMWGKDDEVRNKLKESLRLLQSSHTLNAKDGKELIILLEKTLESLEDMIQKEEEILFPMSLDTLTDVDWYDVYKQSAEIGYTLIDVKETWTPEDITEKKSETKDSGRIQLPSGSFNLEELTRLFTTLPVDITYVNKDDTVKFFSETPDRIFQRSRAIIGRKVQFCHPPHSVSIVEQILADFKSGKQNKADFWIQLHGKFIYISYFALRDSNGEYQGTLEVSQDLTYYRSLTGEKRILSYDSDTTPPPLINKKEIIMEDNIIVYDARFDLANGFHPADKVIFDLSKLGEGDKYKLITPFPPMPLITKAKEKGFSAEQNKISDSEYHTYFFKE